MTDKARLVLLPEQIEAAAKTLSACMDYPWEYMPEQGRDNMRKHALAIINAAAPSLPEQAPLIELAGIAEALAEGGGFWRSCSGCHELNEGHDTGPYSQVFKCALGSGCSECGGIGAVWDNADYSTFGIELPEQLPGAGAMRVIQDDGGPVVDPASHCCEVVLGANWNLPDAVPTPAPFKLPEGLRPGDTVRWDTNGSQVSVTVTRGAVEPDTARESDLVEALKTCRNMVGHPDNIAFIDAAITAAGHKP